MSSLVIAFAGAIKSGKSRLSSDLAAALRCSRVSFGDQVRSEAEARGLDASRDSLQRLGQELATSDPEKLCVEVLGQANWAAEEPLIVVDGLRHKHVAEVLRGLVAPARVKVVFVEATVSIREARLRNQTGEQAAIERYDRHDVESEVNELKSIADLIVGGESNPVETRSELVEWVTELKLKR